MHSPFFACRVTLRLAFLFLIVGAIAAVLPAPRLEPVAINTAGKTLETQVLGQSLVRLGL